MTPQIDATDLERARTLVASMTLAEKVGLSVGDGMFTLGSVERLGIPAWPVTDGPNGARGSSLLGTGPAIALCVPTGTALGATWDASLVERVGVALGEEAITKQSKVLLAPTVNLHRSPLAGRNFECFSEDPLLTGKLAAAYVRGVQSQNVAVTVKHLVGNEAETERYTTDSVIDPRTLRELYLLPFELAVTEGGALGIMTSYNRLNGQYVPERRDLLGDVVRREWGFEGIIMTDWFAAFDTVRAIEGGLDIEMPAGDRGYGSRLAEAVERGEVAEAAVDEVAIRILAVLSHLDALDSVPGSEQNVVRPDHQQLARDAAASATVLLKNDDGLLPLDVSGAQNSTSTPPERPPSLAVIGPNAVHTQIMGGGSAALRPHYRTSFLDAITDAVGGAATITYHPGVSIDKTPPPLSGSLVHGHDGGTDLVVEYFPGDSFETDPAGTTTIDQTKLLFADPPITTEDTFSSRMVAMFTPPLSGRHVFELTQVANTRARVVVDGTVVLDGFGRTQPRSAAFFGSGTEPLTTELALDAGHQYKVEVEATAKTESFTGYQLGVSLPVPPESFDEAVAAAQAADAAIVIVGTNDDWETEGADRSTLDLPGGQDALVSAVAAVNDNTIVVLNTGSVVHVPWRDEVGAILQAWFGGQAAAEATADILFGRAEPGGRLPTTFPVRQEHNPSHGNFPVENGVVRYGEGVLVGYRWYEHRLLDVAYPFGHGLSYTTFEIGTPKVSATTFTEAMASIGDTITVSVPVTNTGERTGSHVVQVYVAPPPTTNTDSGLPSVTRPPKELKGFAKVSLDPGESATVTIALDSRAFAHWNTCDPSWSEMLESYGPKLGQFRLPAVDPEPGWVIAPGTYHIEVGGSSAEITAREPVECDGFRLPLHSTAQLD